MVLEFLELSILIPTSPDRIYSAWLDGEQHAAFTGGGPARVEPVVGGIHSAWDGYISGRNLHLEPNRRIVQSWRSSDFPDGHADSKIEVVLEAVDGGTRLLLRHDDIPEGQSKDLEAGWKEFYFEPMTEYFGDDDDDDEGVTLLAAAAIEEAVEEIMEEVAEAATTALAVELPKQPAVTLKAPAKKGKAAPAKKAKAAPAKKAKAAPAKKPSAPAGKKSRSAPKVKPKPAAKAKPAAKGRGKVKATAKATLKKAEKAVKKIAKKIAKKVAKQPAKKSKR